MFGLSLLAPATLLFVGGAMLNVMTLPTILDDDAAVPILQSIPSAIALFIVAIGYSMLGVWPPAITSYIGVVLWGAIATFRNPNRQT